MEQISFLGHCWFYPKISEINQAHWLQQSSTMCVFIFFFFEDIYLPYIRDFFTFYCQTWPIFNKINLVLGCICFLLTLGYIINLLTENDNKWYYVQNVFVISMFCFFFSLRSEEWEFKFSTFMWYAQIPIHICVNHACFLGQT